MQLRPLEQQEPIADFRSWIQREYLKRRHKNSNYSIRSFALYLDIAAPTLSHLLSGKRRPSSKFVKKLFIKLDAAPEEQNIILNSLVDSGSPSKEKSKAAAADFHLIAMDAFQFLGSWYHFAILEMTSVKNFKLDLVWIASQLEISVTECRQAVERLVRLELVKIENGQLVRTNAFVTNYEEGMTSSAHKMLQRQVLEKALQAVDFVPAAEKDITSITMAIDESKIPEVKQRIKQFRREICAFLEEGSQTRVFNLGIQLYPISKKIDQENL